MLYCFSKTAMGFHVNFVWLKLKLGKTCYDNITIVISETNEIVSYFNDELFFSCVFKQFTLLKVKNMFLLILLICSSSHNLKKLS